jgi:hypothetical protein
VGQTIDEGVAEGERQRGKDDKGTERDDGDRVTAALDLPAFEAVDHRVQ